MLPPSFVDDVTCVTVVVSFAVQGDAAAVRRAAPIAIVL